jgi:hypothetical protein
VFLQIFDEVTDLGSLYQHINFWGSRVLLDAQKDSEAGDASAAQCVESLQRCLSTCETGTRKLNAPLCAPAICPWMLGPRSSVMTCISSPSTLLTSV